MRPPAARGSLQADELGSSGYTGNMIDQSGLDGIVEAAFRLASARPWHEVTLGDIAAEAKMDLAELCRHVASKADILRAFIRATDRRLLASLADQPIEGDGHDRLFDIMLRRFELLAPHKKAIASIVRSPDGRPSEWLQLLASALDSQGWALAAAGLETPGFKGDIHRLGLARVHGATLRVWIEDDDPGLARTMAALDRSLRDGEALMRRLEMPIGLCASFVRAFREFRAARHTAKPEAKSTDEPSHEPAD
jgi:ubiquinone biosynthesis protein COQ9